MANGEKGVLWDEFSTGGLLDDADVEIMSALFSSWDYKGQVNPPVLALKLDLKDAEGNVHEEYLSAGSLDILRPSADGHQALVADAYKAKHPDWESKPPKLNLNTNAVVFVVSLMNADTQGILKSKIVSTDDIDSVIRGTKVHVIRKAAKQQRAKIAAPAAVPGQPQQQDRPQTNLVVEKILAYPGGVAAAAAPVAAGAPASAPAPAGNGAAGAASPVMDQAAGILMAIVATEGGSVKKQVIAGKVMAQMAGEPVPARNAVLGVIVREDFLNSALVSGMGLKYDAATATVSLG